MRYRLEFSQKARQQIRALSKELRRNIGWRLGFFEMTCAVMSPN